MIATDKGSTVKNSIGHENSWIYWITLLLSVVAQQGDLSCDMWSPKSYCWRDSGYVDFFPSVFGFFASLCYAKFQKKGTHLSDHIPSYGVFYDSVS